jgi:hypothetical protein
VLYVYTIYIYRFIIIKSQSWFSHHQHCFLLPLDAANAVGCQLLTSIQRRGRSKFDLSYLYHLISPHFTSASRIRLGWKRDPSTSCFLREQKYIRQETDKVSIHLLLRCWDHTMLSINLYKMSSEFKYMDTQFSVDTSNCWKVKKVSMYNLLLLILTF